MYAKGKRAAIVGAGDAAYDYALNLASRRYEVVMIQRSAPKSLPLLQERVAAESAICSLEEVSIASWHETAEGLEIDLDPPGREALEVDFLIIACGRSPERSLLGSISGQSIETDGLKTPPGLYLGGDLIRGLHRQAGIAVGDGLAAAMAAACYIAE